MSMKNFNAMKLYVSLLLLSSSFCFTACDDDDEMPASPNEVTTKPCSIPIPARHFLPIYLRLKMKAAKRERKSHQESTF